MRLRFGTGRTLAGSAAFALIFAGGNVWAEQPLSAIGWLSQSVDTTTAPPPAANPPQTTALPVATNALPQEVTTTTLDAPSLDGVGLLVPQKTGLPHALWGLGRTDDIAALVDRVRLDGLPALQGLLITVLLAEAEPPADSAARGDLFLHRIDKLLTIGALDQAAALIDAAGDTTSPELFRRAFDVALLTGNDDRACKRLTSSPGLQPTLPARIFCLARQGDWETAAVTLQTAQALNQISADQAELLTRYLDPGLAEGAAALPTPNPVTPLDLQLFETIGEPLSTTSLPLAFAHTDLDELTGWKSRIEAAERLCRVGAIAPNLLLGLYTERKPAASGGVWDRVQAFQDFDAALMAADTEAMSASLPAAFGAMKTMELEVPFADLFAEKLAAFTLTGEAEALAIQVALLSGHYEKLTANTTSTDGRLTFALALARGKPESAPTPDSLSRAIAAGFAQPELPQTLTEMFDQRRTGELILTAAELIARGLEGQVSDVTTGLAILRRLGLEDAARRTALELMLLERRG